MRKFNRLAAGLLAAVALTVVGCGGSDDSGGSSDKASSGPVTIEWWHIGNNDPLKSLWQKTADDYMAAHKNVKIKITVFENEAFKQKLTTNMQAGNPPDIFHSWGGGVLKEQVEAGLVKDVSKDTSSWIGNLNEAAAGLYKVDDKQYGVPYDLGMVGVWYNKSLFKKAGIDAPPETWDEMLADVQKLKDAGITPIAIGEGDKWPGMFWWSNLSLRIAGSEAMTKAGEDGSFTEPGFVEAGKQLKRLIDTQPFQKGFLAAKWEAGSSTEASTMANEKAAMDVMGHWAPATMAAKTKDKKFTSKLGWFPFPTVEGGAGKPGEQFGGGNGYALAKDAPAEAVDFLKFLTDVEQATAQGKSGATLPVTKGAESSITDPQLKTVIETRGEATFVQLYLDQAYAPAVGAAVNDNIQLLFAGKASPEEVSKKIADAAEAG
jgi:raffinose/stachyose/melibiose transport system substrate-binding protein